MEYVVRAKLNKDDDTYIERTIRAHKMETRFSGAVFYDIQDRMIAYFPIVFSVHAREAIS